MGLTPTFTGQEIDGAFESFKDSKEAKFIEIFKYVGEQFVNQCRDLRTYRDQTGNLRSSIGFIIALDGTIHEENWNGDSTGIAHGKDTANKVLLSSKTGIVLIGVAGMEYASAVESRGLDVITGGTLQAEIILKSIMKDVII